MRTKMHPRVEDAIYNAIIGLVMMSFLFVVRIADIYETDIEKNTSVKYVLQWGRPDEVLLGGNYRKTNLSILNCFVTTQRNYFKEVKSFDAIIFNWPHSGCRKPAVRSSNQIYIFSSTESSVKYPLCLKSCNFIFNWTWTFKLNSDIMYYYLIIKNNQSEVIGPAKEMTWINVEDMKPVSDTIKNKLITKSKAAAWFVSNCKTFNRREYFVKDLQTELHTYGLEIDIYGKCGNLTCSVLAQNDCWKMVERDYYFYLSFENSFSEDYVTEKLLNPLQHYTVPIVYGGANYSNFMPDGIYLDALKLGVTALAKEMYDIIKDQKRYENFFKWCQYYSYHAPEDEEDTDPFVKMCTMLNDEDALTEVKMYKDIRGWFNEPGVCDNAKSMLAAQSIVLQYFVALHIAIFYCNMHPNVLPTDR